MKILILTVGLPRSGKSTWAKAQGLPVINPDSIRIALTGHAFYRPAEPMVWAIAKIMVDSLFLSGHELVILDAASTTKKRRDDWLSPNYECAYKVFSADAETCAQRAIKDRREDLCSVIRKMAEEYQSLTKEELSRVYGSI